MKVEYRKREVSWCLDREGGQICLNATIIDNQINSLRITSEEFQVDISSSEIDSFMNLLVTLTETREPEISPELTSEPHNTLEPPFIPEPELTPTPEVLLVDPQQTESKILEESLPLSKEIPSTPSLDDLPMKFPDPFVTPPPHQSQQLEEASTQEEGGLPTQDPIPSPSSKAFDQKSDIASFFRVQEVEVDQVPEEKSPLELILDEEIGSQEKGQEIAPEPTQPEEVSFVHTEANIAPQEEIINISKSLEDLAEDFISSSEKLTEDTPLDPAHTADILETEPELDQTLGDDTTLIGREENESPTLLEPPPMPPLEESRPKEPAKDNEKNKNPSTSRRAELNRLLWELTRGY